MPNTAARSLAMFAGTFQVPVWASRFWNESSEMNDAMDPHHELFRAQLIDAHSYRAMRKYRYALYFIIVLLAALDQRPPGSGGVHPSVIEHLGVNPAYFLLFFVTIIVASELLIQFSQKYKWLGTLRVLKDGLVLELGNESRYYRFEQLAGLTFERGATFHYLYQDRSYLTRFDNWVSFTREDVAMKYEFLIDSEDNNLAFERMIHTLRRGRVKFKYLSI